MSRSPTVSASSSRHAIKWVFLDRDGTLNVKAPEGEYVERPEDLALLPGAAEAVRAFNRAGLWTGVVTNQRGVTLGRMSMGDLDAVHDRLRFLLGLHGASVDAIYVCPHQVGECDCRKPEPGLLLRAQSEQPGLDFARAAIVGDSISDVQAGRRLGLRTVLIADDPSGAQHGQAPAETVDHRVADLAQAARVLLAA
jgi:D-glycero-D-manno-heptose 1,7-bisphosphate phosphatase